MIVQDDSIIVNDENIDIFTNNSRSKTNLELQHCQKYIYILNMTIILM